MLRRIVRESPGRRSGRDTGSHSRFLSSEARPGGATLTAVQPRRLLRRLGLRMLDRVHHCLDR